jgi:thioesterase domain-containing protein/acyl carrier protein
MGILLRELSEAYRAYCLDDVPALPQLPIEYVDFAVWQRLWLRGKVLESRLAFWSEQLATKDSFHHLPTDYPRLDYQTHRGAREEFTLSEDLVESLTALSQREGASLFMTLLAALQGLLHFYSGHKEIVVGTCVANRNRLETEDLIGLFANDVVLKTDLTGNPTFRELLSRVRGMALTAYAHQDVPIGKVVDELQPHRDLSRNPLFQTMFVLQDDPTQLLQIPGVALSQLRLDVGTAQFDLTVLVEKRRALHTTFEYNKDLFEAATIRRVMRDFRIVLEAVASNPEERVGSLLTTPTSRPSNRQTCDAAVEGFVTPTDSTEATLIRIWQSVLKTRSIGVKHNFFELGGDSLQATSLLLRVDEAFGKKFSIASLFQAPTIEQLASLIRSSSTAPKPVQLVPIQPEGHRPPFFCVSINGGGPMYRLLSQQLGEDQPFLGLDLQPLLTTQLDPPYRLQDIAASVANTLLDQYPEGPFLLGGLCVAGLIAYETARQLIAQGHQVDLLTLFECDYPGNWREFAPRHTQFVWLAKRLASSRLRVHLRKLAHLELGEAPAYVGSRLTSLVRSARNIMWQTALDLRSRVNGGRLQNLDQIIYTASKAYRPQPYEGRVVLFQCAERLNKDNQDPLGGWKQVVNGEIDAYEIPGSYWEIYREPNVQILAKALNHCLSEVRTCEKQCS